MPQSPTTNMLLVQPSENGDSGVWDSLLTTLFLLIDAHDHSTGKGVTVKSNGISINADLPMSSSGNFYALTSAKAVDFQPQTAASVAAYAGALFVNSSDSNNLYFRTQAGSNVRITNGSTLDLTVVGGIGGDYSAIPAELNFVDAQKEYTFKSSAGGNWSRLHASSVRIAEHATTESTYVEIACPAALAGTYTITPATALPGSTSVVQISSAGALSYSNTIANSIVMGADQHVTLSGTGEFKHGNRTLVLSVFSGSGSMVPSGVVDAVTASGAGGTWKMAIPLSVGARIRSVQFFYQRQAGTLTFALRNVPLSTGTGATVASTTVASGTTYTSVTISSIDHTLLSTNSYHLSFTSGGTDDLYAALITWDRP